MFHKHNITQTIVELRDGSEKAFDTLYKEYYRGLCSFASQYIPVHECEEVVQDVMMWLWENRHIISTSLSLKTLLFTIVKNKCLNSRSHEIIKQRVHRKLYSRFEIQFEDPDFYVPGELMLQLDKAIKNLPETYRIAFEMNRFENLTYIEIAQKLGVSAKTIAYRISQSLKILRIELKDYLLHLILSL